MATVQNLAGESDRRARFSAAEWEMRVNLAACYRLIAHFRWTDFIYTHISARVPDQEGQFLINAYGLMFEEVTASNLVKVDVDGKVIDDPTGLGANPGGFTIHSAIHMARPEVACVLHTHSNAGVAVAAQKHGLLPITQHALRFYNRIAYHDYEGVSLDWSERQRLEAALGDKWVLILRSHGLLTLGRTVREAFDRIYYLERACAAQIAALAGGAEVILQAAEIGEHVARQFERPERPAAQRDWPALLRLLDRTDPSYKD
jgi:ribulose-5-phosphate 4-epimerase/fuculose-1-phosphate aldolase